MSPTGIAALAQRLVEAADERFDGIITRDQHLAIVARIEAEAKALGYTLDDLDDIIQGGAR